jgi:hypothetical protein
MHHHSSPVIFARKLTSLVVLLTVVGLIPSSSARGAFPGQDGEIYFDSLGGTIHAIAPGGGTARLVVANAASPTISPDGETVAFSRLDKTYGYIWLADIEGGNKTRITNSNTGSRLTMGYPAFSQDGSVLFFAKKRKDMGSEKEIGRVNIDGTGFYPLRSPDNLVDASDPTVSVSGKVIFLNALPGDDGCPTLVRQDPTGGSLTQLTNRSPFYPPCTSPFSPDAHPVTEHFIFVTTHPIPDSPDYRHTIEQASSSSRGPSETLVSHSEPLSSPVYSPSGNFVAFRVGSEIRILDLRASQLRTLQVEGAVPNGRLSWSPVPLDTAAPAAPLITSGPSDLIKETTASLAFTGEIDATFECRLNSGPWEVCASPKAYSGLSGGPHTFQVRQRDQAGNVSEPMTRSWRVIGEQPSPPTPSPSLAMSRAQALSYSGRFARQTLAAGRWDTTCSRVTSSRFRCELIYEKGRKSFRAYLALRHIIEGGNIAVRYRVESLKRIR